MLEIPGRRKVPPLGANDESKPALALFIRVFLGVVFFAAGVVLLYFGLTQAQKTSALNPAVDFTVIDSDCVIKEVVYKGEFQKICERKDDKYNCGCEDTYLFSFSPAVNGTGDNNSTYNSLEEKLERNFQNCNTSAPATPRYSQGEKVKCWRPTVPGGQLPSDYKCGNDDCYIIYDPNTYASESADGAKSTWIAGLVCLAISLPFICAACLPLCSRKDS